MTEARELMKIFRPFIHFQTHPLTHQIRLFQTVSIYILRGSYVRNHSSDTINYLRNFYFYYVRVIVYYPSRICLNIHIYAYYVRGLNSDQLDLHSFRWTSFCSLCTNFFEFCT